MTVAADRIWRGEIAHGPLGSRLNDVEPPRDDIPLPAGPDDYGIAGRHEDDDAEGAKPAPVLATQTPEAWRGTEVEPQRWQSFGRIPAGDLTIFTGNGGAGKTETAVELLVAVAAGLGDWLGAVTQAGTALFLSCEEPPENIRGRIERFAKHRNIDPYDLPGLHLCFPDLDASWLVSADRNGALTRSPLFESVDTWVRAHQPALVVIDSIAAVFDGEAIARRQVRTFLAMLRKLARETGTAIVLLDHPSVRGMADGSGTANSVDWRNSVRSMLHLSDPDKDDPDARVLEVKKSNYGRTGDKVTIRWNGLTFVPDGMGGAAHSPYRAAAERSVDDLFLRLLDKRNAQGRPVHARNAKGSAPTEFSDDPEASGVTAKAFRAAMERLLTANKVVNVETGPASKRRSHLERVVL